MHTGWRAFPSRPLSFALTVETPDTREDASDLSTSTSTQTTARKGPDSRLGARRADEHPTALLVATGHGAHTGGRSPYLHPHPSAGECKPPTLGDEGSYLRPN